MRHFLAALPLLWLAPAGAAAHGVWLAERAGALTIVYGVGPQDEAYKPDKVISVVARAATGEARSTKLVAQKSNATIEAPTDAASFAVVLDNGFWSKGADGKWVNQPKSAVSNAQSSSRSIKFNTHVRASTGASPKPTGATLEILPLADVFKLKPGEDLPVQVLFEGKPLAGVALYPDYVNDANAKSVKTDTDGKATLFVKNNGLNVIGVAHAKPTPDDRDADRLSYFATLSFLIAFVEN
jgi:nickel transport protein